VLVQQLEAGTQLGNCIPSEDKDAA
jgi:hypothetical protein